MDEFKEILKKYFKYTPPIFIGRLASFLGIIIADTVMVSRLGSSYLAAAAFTSSIFGIFFIFSLGIGIAITPIISKNYIKNNLEDMVDILKHSIALNILVGIVLYLLMSLLRINVFRLNQPLEVLNLASGYMKIIALSIIPCCIKDILRRFLEGIGQPKISMFSSILAVIVNLLFNYILIHGKFGFPELKLLGAGVATLLARTVDMVFCAFFIFIYLKKQHLIKIFKDYRLSAKLFRYISKICFPSAFQLTFEIGFFGILTVMVGWLGVIQQAAHAIINSVFRITFIFPLSISIVASIIVSQYFSQKDASKMYKTGLIPYFMLFVFYILCFICFNIFIKKILTIYGSEESVNRYVIETLPMLLFFISAHGINLVGINLLRGIQDTLFSVVITSVAQWLIGIPLAYFLAFKMQLNIKGLWLAGFIAFAFSAIILYLRFCTKLNALYFPLLRNREE